jgi:hypothetical protein
MISAALKAKLSAYAIPVIISLLGVAGLSFWWLWSDRQQLLEENAHLSQAMAQAKVTNEQNLTEISRLRADIRWRERQALIRSDREQTLNEQLARVEGELEELVKDAPCSGPEYVWPDAVYERMRAGTVADPRSDSTRSGTGGVSDTAHPASPTQTD